MKLGLGTAQFGLDYGISNGHGKLPLSEVRRILSFAASKGITVLDSAAVYGTSEEAIGSTISKIDTFAVVTKTAQFNGEVITPRDADELEATFYRSLKRLQQPSIYALLAHRARDLFLPGSELLFRKMVELKQLGLVQKIGVSVYNSGEIDYVLSTYTVDVIQLPVNVFDQRVIVSGHLAQLKNLGIEVHSRSAFLQGILLMNPDALPSYFSPYRQHLHCYHKYLVEQGVSPLRAALGFIRNLKDIDVVICGVDTFAHLQEIYSNFSLTDTDDIDLSRFGIRDVDLLEPCRWVLS